MKKLLIIAFWSIFSSCQYYLMAQPLGKGYSIKVSLDSQNVRKNILNTFTKAELEDIISLKFSIPIDILINLKDTTIIRVTCDEDFFIIRKVDVSKIKLLKKLEICLGNSFIISKFKKTLYAKDDTTLIYYSRFYIYPFIKEE
jgi:hypothetical protein